VHIPDGTVTLGELLSPLGHWKKDDSPAEVVWQWSSEALYHLLAKNRRRINLRELAPNAGFMRHESRFLVVKGQSCCAGLKFKGVGWTDFRPAIAEASAWKPDLLINLTDLEGEAGAEPVFPVLWAVPEGKAEAPWGKIVELD